MEEQDCGDDSKEGDQEIKVYKHRKPPDKRRHQMEKDYLTNLIQEKEAIYKSLNTSRAEKPSMPTGNREELLATLRILKGEKEEKMKRKQVIDAELKGLSQQLQKKTETCTKLQANLRYKDDQRINDAVKRLEKHLNTHQLKLAEEKKLVCEIDSLKRSKKTLSEFLFAKQEVDQLRHHQKKLRDERDTLIRETHGIKAREKDVKTCLDQLRTENNEDESENKEPSRDKEALKNEIDSLYEKRRELIARHRQEMAAYYEGLKKPESKSVKAKTEEKREEMRISKMTPEQRRQQTRPKLHPYEEELNICVCLIQYLEPLRAQSSTDHDEGKPAGQTKFLEVPRSEFSNLEESLDGSFVMKKDENLDGLFAASNRRMTRKGSKKGRKSKDWCQKLVLHPHVFEQFFKLDLEPPCTSTDVNHVLKQLKDKKEVYEQSVKEPITKSLFPEYAGATMLEKDSLRLHLSGEKLRPGAGYSAEDDVEGTIKGEEEPDKECLPNSGCQGSDAIVEAQEVESGRSGLECVDLRSTEVHHTSGISRTSEVSRENNVQTSTRDEQIDAGSERNVFRGEKLALEDVQIVEEDKKSVDERNLNNEEFARNKENSKEIIDDATNMVCSSVITDTLEKGLERLGMKESSKEIQVRVT